MSPTGAGLPLALVTALFWGALPMAVKHVLPVVDATTIVWLRFCVATVWIWVFPERRPARQAAPAAGRLTRRQILLLAVAVVGLGGNFVMFNSAVGYLDASVCQIMAQGGPVLLLLGSVFVLRESFLPIQAGCVVVLLAGMLLFFNTRLEQLFAGTDSRFLVGMLLSAGASTIWSFYGIAQKVLLRSVSPTRLMRIIYLCCALGLTPFASPADILRLHFVQGLCLVFACINTLVAYGAFVKAMSIWHAAKVSAVVTTTPLFTIFLEAILQQLLPGVYEVEPLGLLGYVGALVVVVGALGIAVGPMLHWPRRLMPRRGA